MVRSLLLYCFLNFSIACISGDNQDWTKLPGQATWISAKGNEIWILDVGSVMSRWSNGTWQTIPETVKGGTMDGNPLEIAAAQDGWTWMKTNTFVLYRWNPNDHVWEKIPTGGDDIGVMELDAFSRDSAIIRVTNVSAPPTPVPVFDFWVYKNNTWEKMPHQDGMDQNEQGALKTVAIGENDDRYVLAHNFIYRWNRTANPARWEKLPGQGAGNEGYIVKAQNSIRVIKIKITPPLEIYMWNGVKWNSIPIKKDIFSAGIDSDAIYIIDSDGNIFSYKI